MPDPSTDRDALVASLLDAVNRQDPDAMVRLVHPDYEFHARFAALDGRVYKGPRGFREYFRDLGEGFLDPKWELEEARQTPSDELYVVFRFTAQGRESGFPIDRPAAQVWSFRDGLVWRNVSYGSREEALEAAGLSD